MYIYILSSTSIYIIIHICICSYIDERYAPGGLITTTNINLTYLN